MGGGFKGGGFVVVGGFEGLGEATCFLQWSRTVEGERLNRSAALSIPMKLCLALPVFKVSRYFIALQGLLSFICLSLSKDCSTIECSCSFLRA